jgi:hypothetical protein
VTHEELSFGSYQEYGKRNLAPVGPHTVPELIGDAKGFSEANAIDLLQSRLLLRNG